MEKKESEKLAKHITDTIKKLGIKPLHESLNKTIFLLTFGGLKSMQTAFDEAFDEVTASKRHWSWRMITDCLNEHTTLDLSVLTVKTMYKRAKKKRGHGKTV